MFRYLILLIIAAFPALCRAQIPYVDSKEILKKGIGLHDLREYKKAIELYRQVHECDTNYALAVYEQVLSLQADSSCQEAKKYALYGLTLPRSDKREFLLALAAAYDYLQMPDSSLFIYDSVTRRFPLDHQAYYEEGILHFRKKRYDIALSCFQKSLIINPNHYRSHYMAGLTYTLLGRLSEGMIALEASMLMTQSPTFAKQSVSMLSSIAEGTDEIVTLYRGRSEQYSHPLFDELDQLVNSKLALSKEYKLNMDLNDNIFRQSQAVMEKLKYDPGDTNFVMQYYVPLLTGIFSSGGFEAYTLLSFSEFGYENVDNLAKKRSKEISEMKGIVFPYFSKIKATREWNYNKRQTAIERYHYYPEDDLVVVGKSVSDGDKSRITGDVEVYRASLTLLSRGHYNDKGEKDGAWTNYYTTGAVMSKQYFVNGQERDTAITYFINGNYDKITLRDKAGNIAAEYQYTFSGWLSDTRKKVSDKITEETSYYANGQQEIAVKYEGDNIKDGSYTSYFKNGKVKKQFGIRNGKYNGRYKIYFENGQLSEEGSYVSGDLDGPYTSYYESGKVKERYTYKNGSADGAYEEFFDNGKLSEKGVYHKGHKDEVNKYSPATGKVFAAIRLRNEVPVSIRFTDENNKPVFEQEDKKGIYEYALWYPNGNKSVDMKLDENGSRDGLITFYETTGAKSDEINYKNGNREGRSVSYFVSGKVKVDENYVNDKKDGYAATYYDNGVLKQEGWFKEGKKQGLWRYYYGNGKMSSEAYFLNGNVNGYYKEFNINGEITDKYIYTFGNAAAHVCYDTAGNKTDSVFYGRGEAECKLTYRLPRPLVADVAYSIRYGVTNGVSTVRYINGTAKASSFYIDGLKDSISTAFFPDGKMASQGRYMNGDRVGQWRYYNEVGDLVKEENYNANGYLDGKVKAYACSFLHTEYNFKNGNKDGEQKYYGEDGRVAVVLYFDEGDITGYTYEGKDGRLLPQINIKNGTGKVAAVYANGQKSFEAEFIHNLAKGPFRVYYSNGQLAEEHTNNENFDLEGPYRRFQPDGKLEYEAYYKDDEENGVEKSFDKKGNLAVSCSFYSGVQHGPTTVTDPATNITTAYNYRYGQLISVSQ